MPPNKATPKREGNFCVLRARRLAYGPGRWSCDTDLNEPSQTEFIPPSTERTVCFAWALAERPRHSARRALRIHLTVIFPAGLLSCWSALLCRIERTDLTSIDFILTKIDAVAKQGTLLEFDIAAAGAGCPIGFGNRCEQLHNHISGCPNSQLSVHGYKFR